MKKIVANFYGYSPKKIGNEIDMQTSLADHLNQKGCELLWIFISCKYDELFESYQRPGLDIEIVPFEKGGDVQLMLSILSIIRRRNVQVMHLQFIKPMTAMLLIILARVFLKKTAFIYHKRSPGTLINSRLSFKRHVSPLRVLSLFVDKIIANSDSIRENCLNRYVKPNKVVRIYNGTVMDKFENARDEAKIRTEFKIPQHYRIVSIIKDARPEVGLRDLLSSIPKVLREFQEVVFLIVGGGIETESLKVLAAQLGIEGHVIFAGIRDDIPKIIAESFFTVDPSPVEAFGFVIIESMAGGRPVIAVNAWGPREIIVHGKTGLLVKPGKPTDFAQAITEMLNSPDKVKEMGVRSYLRVKDLFTIQKMSEETAKATVEVLSIRTGSGLRLG